MTKQDQEKLLLDFREWSGGFGPEECEPKQLVTYVETALAGQHDKKEALAFLYRRVCTCIPGTGHRDPSCNVHGDGKEESHA